MHKIVSKTLTCGNIASLDAYLPLNKKGGGI